MGYMGFGMRQWISNMKPKPYFGRRNNPGSDHKESIAGHDVQDFYHLKQNRLENLSQKKSTPIYLKTLRNKMRDENRKQLIGSLLIIALSLSVLAISFIYLSKRFDLF